MKLLLDTHTLLWCALNDPQLSGNARSAILDPANEVYVSPATYGEMPERQICDDRVRHPRLDVLGRVTI